MLRKKTKKYCIDNNKKLVKTVKINNIFSTMKKLEN